MTTTAITPTRRVWKQSAIALVLVGGGFALGAASLAVAHGDMGPGGMEHGWGHHHGPRVGMIQHFTRRALDDVGASTAQEDKVHDIIASAYTELQKDGGGERGTMRKQVLELMKAPTLDKAAFEKLRAQKISDMETKSKVVSNALFDAAGQLTPEQRAKLVDKIEARMDHGHGGVGGWQHHDRMDGQHRMDGPDGGPKGGHGPDADHG